jgi:hypothetical protein
MFLVVYMQVKTQNVAFYVGRTYISSIIQSQNFKILPLAIALFLFVDYQAIKLIAMINCSLIDQSLPYINNRSAFYRQEMG